MEIRKNDYIFKTISGILSYRLILIRRRICNTTVFISYSRCPKWYTTKQLSDMIAISSITPGPVGVNVATFAGFTTAGVTGAFVATASVILPSLIIIIIISKLLEQFRHNKYVQSVIYTLKPAGCGLLAAVGVDMFINNINLFGMVLLAGLFIASITEKEIRFFISECQH